MQCARSVIAIVPMYAVTVQSACRLGPHIGLSVVAGEMVLFGSSLSLIQPLLLTLVRLKIL